MMRRLVCLFVLVVVASGAQGTVFDRFLSPDRPMDRAIIKYVELDKAGNATSRDLTELAVLVNAKGFPADATKFFKKALKLDKKNFEAAYRLGLVYLRMGEPRSAAKYYKKSLKVRPGYSYPRFMLALVEESLGHRSQAIYHYAKAYRHMPELADPDKNPLLSDSRLQTEAQLLRYRREAVGKSFPVTSLDPDAVRRMGEAILPAPPTPALSGAQATPAPPTQPAPQPDKPKTKVVPVISNETLSPAKPTPVPPAVQNPPG